MNNNNKENKQVQATKDIRRVSAKKVLLRAAVLTVVSGLILFITMIGVFYMKLSSGMIRQLDILNEAIDSAVDAPEDAWNSSAEYYSDVILSSLIIRRTLLVMTRLCWNSAKVIIRKWISLS